MRAKNIDLIEEHKASLARPKHKYSLTAKFFFFSMDLVTGKKNTLCKAALLEILASVPYREWEIRSYKTITRYFRNSNKVCWSQRVIEWGREAQDNEYDHLRVIYEKMKEDNIKEAWYLSPVITFIFVLKYVIISKIVAFLSLKSAFYFNGEFEDHAEHVYAQMVEDNPQWRDQPIKSPIVKQYADVENWSQVFINICLDERDHRNESFVRSDYPQYVAQYKNNLSE